MTDAEADGPLVGDWEQRLTRYAVDEPEPAADPDQAAVAAVLREGAFGPEVLLMVRAEREGDRWSGQVSLPGGKAEAEDPDLAATARRETHEELGIDLDARGRRLCRLPGIQARARGGPVSLFITPFAYATTDPGPVHLSEEASDHFWLPLVPTARGELDDRYRLDRPEGDLLLPAWRFEERVIWGLTHRMLSGLIGLLREPGA